MQPHDFLASEITNGAVPVLVNLNSYMASPNCLMVPKSCSSFSNSISGPPSERPGCAYVQEIMAVIPIQNCNSFFMDLVLIVCR